MSFRLIISPPADGMSDTIGRTPALEQVEAHAVRIEFVIRSNIHRSHSGNDGREQKHEISTQNDATIERHLDRFGWACQGQSH